MKHDALVDKMKEHLAALENLINTLSLVAYNPTYGDTKLCTCGHLYYRHFDTYDGMRPVGCKYCECCVFNPAL